MTTASAGSRDLEDRGAPDASSRESAAVPGGVDLNPAPAKIGINNKFALLHLAEDAESAEDHD